MVMNKQLVAFLSMFSLVLVLSIYYVLMPGKTTDSAEPVIDLVSEASDPYFETILLEQEENYNEIIEEQYQIVSSSEYSNSEKVIALETIAKIQETRDNEKAIRDIIIDAGYPSAFVELYDDDSAYVLTISKTKTKLEVAQIIYYVQDFLNEEISVTVSFR